MNVLGAGLYAASPAFQEECDREEGEAQGGCEGSEGEKTSGWKNAEGLQDTGGIERLGWILTDVGMKQEQLRCLHGEGAACSSQQVLLPSPHTGSLAFQK